MALETTDFVINQTWQEVGAGSTERITIDSLSPRDHYQFAYGDAAPTSDRAGYACRGIDAVTCDASKGHRVWVRVFGANKDITVRVTAD